MSEPGRPTWLRRDGADIRRVDQGLGARWLAEIGGNGGFFATLAEARECVDRWQGVS
jgi:hypothetical protein